jgi:uncharacterized membrane protein
LSALPPGGAHGATRGYGDLPPGVPLHRPRLATAASARIVEELFKEYTAYAGLAIEAVGVLLIALGSAVAVVQGLQVFVTRASAFEKRVVWLHYAQWLIAGLTFQLAADIVHTAIAPSWDDIGKLATIAVIRTFLTFFLDRDMENVRALQEDVRSNAVEG